MKIVLPDPGEAVFAGRRQVLVNGRARWATAADVAFVNDRLWVISLLPRCLTIIEPDLTVGATIPLLGFADTLDVLGSTAIVVNFPTSPDPDGSLTVLDVSEAGEPVIRDHFVFPGLRTHGGTLVDATTAIVTNTYNERRGLYWVDVASGRIVDSFNGFEFYPKDVCVVGAGRLLLAASKCGPGHPPEAAPPSVLSLWDTGTMTMLHSVDLVGLTDTLCWHPVHGGFVTIQDTNIVARFTLVDDKIVLGNMLGGFDFPHGCDVDDTRLAVTNFGDNSVDVIPLDTLPVR